MEKTILQEYDDAFKKTFDEILPSIKEAFESEEKMLQLMNKCFLAGWRGCALAIKDKAYRGVLR